MKLVIKEGVKSFCCDSDAVTNKGDIVMPVGYLSDSFLATLSRK